MEKENLYLIHGEDYLRHIEEKLELLWMATKAVFRNTASSKSAEHIAPRFSFYSIS